MFYWDLCPSWRLFENMKIQKSIHTYEHQPAWKPFVCPMCPGIGSGEPGDCPKCGMPLERTERKIAFITGANRGLGLETARGLGKLGITVLLGSREPVERRESRG